MSLLLKNKDGFRTKGVVSGTWWPCVAVAKLGELQRQTNMHAILLLCSDNAERAIEHASLSPRNFEFSEQANIMNTVE
ncbi:uncharacterized protein PRCAT00002029001 [Priceomyces carsonii]|uniref:uncharacterized protein n=1 Tax=Priceomyces carsonii TaxID=28549 RepID=UPI002EDA6CD2|nr:unnamed protein product [Priceomyces carsonii]